MNPFLKLFCLITLISLAISGGLLMIRRWLGGRGRSREHIHPALFNFFTTLYAFFIGFAIVTLWSAFLTAKKDVIREADAMLITYRSVRDLPGAEAFRLALKNYVKTVGDVEWGEMGKGSMSSEAGERFDDIWSAFYALKCDPLKADELSGNLKEAGQQRLSRSTILGGNLYLRLFIGDFWFVLHQSGGHRGVPHLRIHADFSGIVLYLFHLRYGHALFRIDYRQTGCLPGRLSEDAELTRRVAPVTYPGP